MQPTHIRPLIVALAALAALPSLGDDGPPHSFWQDGRHGWFFYQAPPEPAEEEPAEPETPPSMPESAPEPTPAVEAPQPSTVPPAPPPLSAEWFRENLDRYADEAWNNPTPENVRAYMYMQRYVMDRAQAFSEAAELAVLGDPILDETSRRPTASTAAQRLAEQANNNRNAIVRSLGERIGIFFFYSSDCASCAAMLPVVRELERDFALIPISLDGEDLPGNPFPNMRIDQGHARQLGVPRAPALYLAAPGEVFEPIAHSPVSLDDARHRILVGAYRQGWVSDAEMMASRPVTNQDLDLTRILPEGFATPAEGDETNFIPPSDLLRAVEAAQQRYIEELAR